MLLERHILPALGEYPMRKLTPAIVRQWHARTLVDRPALRAHSYALLRTICGTAVADDLTVANPCRIRGAGQSARVSKTEPASLSETHDPRRQHARALSLDGVAGCLVRVEVR